MQSANPPLLLLDEVEQLGLIARELERAANRVAFAGFIHGRPDERDAVWTFSSPRGSVVLKDGRYELASPRADECAHASPEQRAMPSAPQRSDNEG